MPLHPRQKAARYQVGGYAFTTKGISRFDLRDPYHIAVTLTWPQFLLTLLGVYLAVNLLFAALYTLVPGSVVNVRPGNFAEAFFFSFETLATVGYGDMHPITLYGHSIAMLEIFVGLMSLALITGIMFARFSRPRARFLFARYGVVRPIDGNLTLMFRAANARLNVVQEASAQLRMMRDEVTTEGFRIRRITDLALVRSQHPMFFLGWNIMHVIDASSPLRSETAESLRQAGALFILSVGGTDDTTGQVLMARAEYTGEDIRWNQSFRDILERAPDGTLHIDYGKFHDVEPFSPTTDSSATFGKSSF